MTCLRILCLQEGKRISHTQNIALADHQVVSIGAVDRCGDGRPFLEGEEVVGRHSRSIGTTKFRQSREELVAAPTPAVLATALCRHHGKALQSFSGCPLYRLCR